MGTGAVGRRRNEAGDLPSLLSQSRDLGALGVIWGNNRAPGR